MYTTEISLFISGTVHIYGCEINLPASSGHSRSETKEHSGFNHDL